MEEKRQKFIEKINREHIEHTKKLLEMDKEQILEHAAEYCVEKLVIAKLPEIGITGVPSAFFTESDYDLLLQKEDLLHEIAEFYTSVEWDEAENLSTFFIEIARCNQEE